MNKISISNKYLFERRFKNIKVIFFKVINFHLEQAIWKYGGHFTYTYLLKTLKTFKKKANTIFSIRNFNILKYKSVVV